MARGTLYGLLLAAGRGSRYRARCADNKLLVPSRLGQSDAPAVALAAARALLPAVDRLVVVIPEHAPELVDCLGGLPATLVPIRSSGIGDSIAQALRHCPEPRGVIIALADMPYVQPDTLLTLASLLQHDNLVVPTWQGRRGHPRGIGGQFAAQLLTLQGDRGAQALFDRPEVVEVAVEDPRILHDIDLPEHLLH